MIRSQFTLINAEKEYARGRLLRALVLALIGIGWMIDDLSCFQEEQYDRFTQVDIYEPKSQRERK